MSRAPRIHTALYSLVLAVACGAGIGCGRIPGKPGPGPEVVRPEEVVDFPALYKQNCAACHGDNGRNGAAISLSNPVYLALAGENRLRGLIANGVPGKLMPAFAMSAGGMLTDGQVTALAQGMVNQWGNPKLLEGQSPPSYLETSLGNAGQGLQAYQVFCARCHGANGEGGPADGMENSSNGKLGSIVDPSYLALISNQNLRSILIAGRPDEAMPDWRNDATRQMSAKAMTEQQITDIVAWLASKRIANPGQPYLNRP
jgi:cytochrome c oxidase cbb3-type subunit 3/ubiquinol-cytochrome c reductase cytochrome c subunit